MYNAPKDYAVTLVLASGEVVDTGIRKGEPIKDEFGKRALWREHTKHKRESAPAFEVWRLDNNVSGRKPVELVARGAYDRVHGPDDRAWIDLVIINWFERQMTVVDVFPVTAPAAA